MPAPSYAFHSTWRISASPKEVYDVLARLEHYPSWWREVRRAEPLNADACALTIRSLLPLELRVVAHHERKDPDALVLRARLTGDLDGFSQWTVVRQDGGAAALFEEKVRLRHRLAGAPGLGLLRPALELNHALMMRSGEKGLRTAVRGH